MNQKNRESRVQDYAMKTDVKNLLQTGKESLYDATVKVNAERKRTMERTMDVIKTNKWKKKNAKQNKNA